MLLYNICIALYVGLLKLVAPWNKKAKQWVVGRKNIFERMSDAIASTDKVVWMHVASLGEFEQGRPIIEQMRKLQSDVKILLTFFSPSASSPMGETTAAVPVPQASSRVPFLAASNSSSAEMRRSSTS